MEASSSPVAKKATRSLRFTVTSPIPSEAIRPRSAGREQLAGRSTGDAGLQVLAGVAHVLRLLLSRRNDDAGLPSFRATSWITTVSVPAGITAPVMTRTH